MADNVFGNPITNSTLEAMPEYEGKTITRQDRAHVALNMKNAQGKDKAAQDYVENLRIKWGDGVATLCVVYNATGDTIKFVCEYSWHGHIGSSPYPYEIANGQWGAFLHVKTAYGMAGSAGAVVYRGLNNFDTSCDWMVAWSNPYYRSVSDNTAYTEIREMGHYDTHDYWEYIFDLLNESGLVHADSWNNCLSNVSTGSDTNPIFEGILTLP
ncbi:23 kDa jasmonate-induced protein-like [Benincasa hispida]|uniref:23 kDa jasmonate-induced protein-like n=1 Tax=Benincasa hispida TaxID=102211 RepID=UPI0018FFC30D|nr:23 kDa jasmonate-induced protein-like [Benincasa hispida]